MKRCRRCGEEKPLEEFPKRDRRHSRDGRYGYCRPCTRILGRERMRKWREANPEKARANSTAASRKLRSEQPDYFRKWYQANIEGVRLRSRNAMRQQREKDPEAARESVRRWRRNNPEAARTKDRENTHRRRALMQGTSNALAAFMAELVNEPCVYCGAIENITVDHVVPLSRGGEHVPANLAPACYSCNASKNNRLLSEWSGRKAA